MLIINADNAVIIRCVSNIYLKNMLNAYKNNDYDCISSEDTSDKFNIYD